jgi:CubicO group peptidase (beta-lactamase class C family)
MPGDEGRRIIRTAIDGRVFPAAVAEVGDHTRRLWSAVEGRLTFDPGAPPTTGDTPFDLASLTKVVATTTVVMQLVADRTLELDEPVAAFFDEWRGADREIVTVRDLLEHASGLPARLVDAPPEGRREFEHEICRLRLEYRPRTTSVYSDLGFILLGFLAADRGQRSLASQFDAIQSAGSWSQAADAPLSFELPAEARRRAAPTQPMHDDPRRGRTLAGEVHDNYAAALGGVAGHAGLFGSAPAVAAFARIVLRAARGETIAAPFTADAVALFTARTRVPGSSRALGWDTMLPTSSCGTHMSAAAFGHVGYTGSSLWIDPARDRYFVLLTNRACGGGTLDEMREVRRAFHDALAEL